VLAYGSLTYNEHFPKSELGCCLQHNQAPHHEDLWMSGFIAPHIFYRQH